MVDDLVDVHLLEEGLHSYVMSDIDLSALVRQSMDAFAGMAGNKRIRLTCHLPANPVRLKSNSHALRQVLDNLVSNALKYSPASSEVRVELQTTDRGCQLRVCDQGPGVKEEEREQIFEKYGRGSASPTGGEKSTGLGLWIVWRIVHSLQGKVWLEPAAGKTGTVFVVEFSPQPPVA
jgi:signal transduction histidine kinase